MHLATKLSVKITSFLLGEQLRMPALLLSNDSSLGAAVVAVLPDERYGQAIRGR